MSSKAITIYTPTGTSPHIAAQDDAFIYNSMLGGRSGILGGLVCALEGTSQVRLSGGGVSNLGYVLRIPEGESCTLTLPNGTQGMKRNDIVAAQFTKGDGSVADEHIFVIITGTAAASPSDPVMTTSELVNQGDVRQLPLFRIKRNGLETEGIERIAVDASLQYTAPVAQSCTGNSATATVAASCSGNSATATTAAGCSGNSATATALATPVTLTFSGDASGSAEIDGTENVTMNVSVLTVGGHRIYIQSSAPEAPAEGDIWLW